MRTLNKFSAQFPEFNSRAYETELGAWEDYWEAVSSFQRMTQCPDLIAAYLIRDSAPKQSDLAHCLSHVCNEPGDGKLDIDSLGLTGIKALMSDDFEPKTHFLASQARQQVMSIHRKFKERPKWYFRRFDIAYARCKRLDKEFQLSEMQLADMYYFNSGLERKDREKMFRESNNKWNSTSFKTYILSHYDTVHELDCHMIA